MDREELLRRLQQVRECVKKISGLQKEQIDLAVKYQRETARSAFTENTGKTAVLGGATAALGADLLVVCLISKQFACLAAALAILGISALTWKTRAGGGDASGKDIRWAKALGRWAPYVCFVLLLLLALAVRETIFSSILMTLLTILVFAGSFAVCLAARKWKNTRLSTRNQQLQLQNAEIRRQYFQAVESQEQMVRELRRLGQGWYPEEYYTMDAVEFFVHAVRNFRAESVQEMVDLYEDDGYKKITEEKQDRLLQMQQDIVRNEQQMLGELKYVNVLHVMRLNMQAHAAQGGSAAASAAGSWPVQGPNR